MRYRSVSSKSSTVPCLQTRNVLPFVGFSAVVSPTIAPSRTDQKSGFPCHPSSDVPSKIGTNPASSASADAAARARGGAARAIDNTAHTTAARADKRLASTRKPPQGGNGSGGRATVADCSRSSAASRLAGGSGRRKRPTTVPAQAVERDDASRSSPPAREAAQLRRRRFRPGRGAIASIRAAPGDCCRGRPDPAPSFPGTHPDQPRGCPAAWPP